MTHDVETRLARLAPASSPAPRALHAARVRVDDAVGLTADAPTPVVGLPEHFSPDVVVPRARPEQRRRRVLLAVAASVAAVAVAGAVVVPALVAPRVVDAGTRAMIDGCATDLPDASTIAVERIDGAALALLSSGDSLVFCTASGTTTIAPADDPWTAPDGGRVDVIGAMMSGLDEDTTETAWIGQVGAGVESVELATTSGRDVEATVSGRYWVAMFLGAADEDAETVTWTLDDGTSRTAPASRLGG
jgi:hypothetical protein